MSASRLPTVAIALAALAAAAGCARRPADNVLFVTLDTTRADFLGCYGRDSARTPNLDQLAAEGYQFLDAYTPVPITLPSHSTMFTGRYPLAHGVRDNGLFTLPDDEVTLAERLRARGWATGAAVGSFPLTRQFNIQQGFDFFDDHITIDVEDYHGRRLDPRHGLYFDERPAALVNDAILPWLRDHLDQPFFAWIHYWDAHHPHVPPPPYDQLYAYDLYQGEIAYVDHSLGVVLDQLRRAGVYDRTLIVVVGDHGEGRGDHNEDSHSMLVYGSTLHVPLIIKPAGAGHDGHRIADRVGTVDIAPTVLDLLGIGLDDSFQGRSLTGLMGLGDGPTSPAEYYAESLSPRLSYGWGEQRALYDGRFKYIFGPRQELYDLVDDPGERRNIVDARPDEAAELRQRLQAFIAGHVEQGAANAAQEVDAETRRRLEALGYISSGGAEPGSITEELRSDGTPPQDRIGDINVMSNVKQSLDGGDYLDAKNLAELLIQRDPDNPYYRGLLAAACLGLGRTDQAAEVAEQLHRVTAQNDTIVLAIARQLFSAGERERGLELAARVVRDQESAYGQYLLGEMQCDLGRSEECESHLRRAGELDPRQATARLSLAIHVAESGRLSEAETLLDDYTRDFPLDEKGWFNSAVLLLQDQRWDQALERLERAVELRPTYWDAQIARVAVLVQTGRAEQARAVVDWLRGHGAGERVVARAKEIVAES